MNLLTDNEKISTANDVQDLILASGQEAVLLRSQSGERLYGSYVATYEEVGLFPLEFVEIPSEDLNNKIDAVACVLSDMDIRPEDHIRSGADEFRVQTIEDERLFGAV